MELDEELNDSERTPCEIWSRVMGYHGPIDSWNVGKKAEHRDRVYFVDSKSYLHEQNRVSSS